MAVVAAERFDARNIQTLTSAVQREIERRILTGEIAAGARLTEAPLAEELGVSRGPVREAIRGLIQAGLVDSIANRGGVVRKIGLDEALDLYELRAVLFGFACELVARRRTEAQLAELEAALDEMATAVAARDKDRYYQLNLAFHARLMDALRQSPGACRLRGRGQGDAPVPPPRPFPGEQDHRVAHRASGDRRRDPGGPRRGRVRGGPPARAARPRPLRGDPREGTRPLARLRLASRQAGCQADRPSMELAT